MAGRSELPSGRPSSFRRTELRLGEPEPPAKKRIIDVAVLVEPCQLARYVRCSLPTAGVFSESGLGALWQAFARSLSGRRRQGRRWLEWLPNGLSAGLGGSASRTRSTQQCSPRLFTRAEEHTQRFRLGFCDFYAECRLPLLACLLGSVAHTGVCPALAPRSERLHHDDRNISGQDPHESYF